MSTPVPKPPPPDRPHPVLQQRSRETVERLLDAAEAALRDKGPEGATLRAIADQAGLSLGIVYRRFPDKDTVLRAVYMRFFERAALANARSFARLSEQEIPISTVVRQVVEGIVAGYRTHRALLRALLLYARTHEDDEFRRRAEAVTEVAVEAAVRVFEPRIGEIDHPDPVSAIRFGLRSAGAILQDLVLFHPDPAQAPPDPAREVTRLLVRYLGLSEEPARRGGGVPGKRRSPR